MGIFTKIGVPVKEKFNSAILFLILKVAAYIPNATELGFIYLYFICCMGHSNCISTWVSLNRWRRM